MGSTTAEHTSQSNVLPYWTILPPHKKTKWRKSWAVPAGVSQYYTDSPLNSVSEFRPVCIEYLRISSKWRCLWPAAARHEIHLRYTPRLHHYRLGRYFFSPTQRPWHESITHTHKRATEIRDGNHVSEQYGWLPSSFRPKMRDQSIL